MTRKAIGFSKTQRLFRSLRTKGILKTTLILLSYCVDYLFDRKYKIDTFSSVKLDDLGVDDAKKEHAVFYQATHVAPLKKLFKVLRIPAGKIIVDLGCGKGRVLLIASEFGFKEVRGVEFSPLLCDIANNNFSKYIDRRKTNIDFAIFESDVLDYRIKDDENVFFLFNPFDAYILRQALQNILISFQKQNRKLWVICYEATHRGLVEEKMNPTKVLNFTFWGSEFVVFEIEQGATTVHNFS